MAKGMYEWMGLDQPQAKPSHLNQAFSDYMGTGGAQGAVPPAGSHLNQAEANYMGIGGAQGGAIPGPLGNSMPAMPSPQAAMQMRENNAPAPSAPADFATYLRQAGRGLNPAQAYAEYWRMRNPITSSLAVGAALMGK